MDFFKTPYSKNTIATLRLAKIKKKKLTFLLVSYFDGLI